MDEVHVLGTRTLLAVAILTKKSTYSFCHQLERDAPREGELARSKS